MSTNFLSINFPYISAPQKIPFDLWWSYVCKPVLIIGFFYGSMKGFTQANCDDMHPNDALFKRTTSGIITGLTTVTAFVTNPWIPLKLILTPIRVIMDFLNRSFQLSNLEWLPISLLLSHPFRIIEELIWAPIPELFRTRNRNLKINN